MKLLAPNKDTHIPARSPAEANYHRQLHALLDQLPDLQGAVLAKSDGFEVASVARDTLPAARLSALASSMSALGDAALRELGFDGGDSILIEGRSGKLLLLTVPQGEPALVLAVIGSAKVVTGSLLWAARECVRRIIQFPTVTE